MTCAKSGYSGGPGNRTQNSALQGQRDPFSPVPHILLIRYLIDIKHWA
jgi:hypothetical protein